MAERTFVSGWNPELAQKGRAAFDARGQRLFTAPRFLADDRPLPAGFSLLGFLLWAYDQGPVGSCFANMMAHIMQLMMRGAEANGSERKVFNPSRRLIWHQTRKLDGSLGSRSDGGSIVNSFASCGPIPNGTGDCKEEEWPYKPNHDWLEAKPPADVITHAGDTRVAHIADAPLRREEWCRSIFNLSPIGIGIWWPGADLSGKGWDYGYIDKFGRTTGYGGGGYGHAISVVGWIKDWDGHFYWQILNSHGPIYGTPPQDVASTIAGYKPTNGDKCFSFWAREDLLQKVMSYQYTEHYVAAGVEGFVPKPINVADFSDAYPV